MDPLMAVFLIIGIWVLGFFLIKGFKLGSTAKTIFAIPIALLAIIALGGFAEQANIGFGGGNLPRDIYLRAADATWQLDTNLDSTAGNWEDTIHTDVDLWAATGNGTCDDSELKCTANIEFVYSTGGVTDPLFPNEYLIDVVVKNTNDAFPEGIAACDNGCWPLVASMGSVPYTYNTTDGNSLPVVDMNNDYLWNAYFDDADGNPWRIVEHRDYNLGLFRPGQSQTVRIGVVGEPYAFGAGGLAVYDSFSLYFTMGGQTVELEMLITILG
ncbi:MAG: hypothetical protein JSW41_00420 [Candidatus Aenigmatarchaeota archaeon]|nr:MAG: hypothetical protein JSW41_00420 [Candidatus Aenigmarchaeota archaeon]